MHGRKLAYKEPQNQGDYELSTKDIIRKYAERLSRNFPGQQQGIE
jgi:hypothetical protein